MTHFETFDKRKATPDFGTGVFDEARLCTAFYGLNNLLPADYLDRIETSPRLANIVRMRDEVFALGQDLYGWED